MGCARAASSRIFAVVLPCLAAVVVALLPPVVQPFPLADSQAAALLECEAEWGMSAMGWAQGAECAQAQAITCDQDGMVTSLDVHSSGLNGSLPLALTRLSRLHTLDLGFNDLWGPVPPTLSTLVRLRTLVLDSNYFTGRILSIVSNMTLLVDLTVAKNRFTGSIPPAISRLRRLTNLEIDSNNFQGPLPQELGHLTALSHLSMSSTALSGSLPGSISQLAALQYLYAPMNGFTGSIPTAFAALSRLKMLALDFNPLMGSLPGALSRLTTLTQLTLSGTSITGVVPRSFSALTRLNVLDLSNTKLHGAIPATLGGLTNLQILMFSGATCPLEGTCEVNQNRSSAFCRICSSFCSTCIPINAVGALLLLLLAVAVVGGWGVWRWRKGEQGGGEDADAPMLKPAPPCPHIPLSDVIRATNGWAEGRRVGGGRWRSASERRREERVEEEREGLEKEGAGRRKVWGGRCLWAVKRMRRVARSAAFEAHVLVYEWMENGSLEQMLLSGASPLSLRQRVDILVGVLRALKAVQSHGLVHGDLKPSNVLLGAAYEPRVGDWSVVRMGQRVHVDMGGRGGQGVGEGEKEVLLEGGSEGQNDDRSEGRSDGEGRSGDGRSGFSGSSSGKSGNSSSSGGSAGRVGQASVLRCTEGHVDPMVLQSGVATATADMYSVGVVLLQLLTGWAAPFKSLDGQHMHICHWAQQHVTAGDVSPLLDPLLLHPAPPPSLLLSLFHLALSCASPFPSSRPTPSSALLALKPLRASLLQLQPGEGRTGEGEGGERGEGGEDGGGGRRSGSWSRLFGSGAGGGPSGNALGARLAMLGAEDSREFVA
ncbi:hypothetical protein CLOM_g2711 [Closterium sp. NIES-68]|nr:hypothetical protein CLOM_g2711 [Closterium sp. NIES-68]